MPPTNTKNPYENSIFWIDVEKIQPNPYQPRKEFDEQALRDLSDSIRQYGILQPLVVSRVENWNEDGSLNVSYELIAGERRLRASKLAHLSQVPVIIRTGDDSRAKLELAILENLQREDLNPVDRAKAFARLATEFNLKHQEIGQKVSKSREYVSNTLRLLTLPEDILNALATGKISEGHTRPLMMLSDRPEEQLTLFKEMLIRKMTVREAENIARRIAFDKARKKDRFFDPDIAEMEGTLAETLGTRVHIEKREVGGKILIDFFSFEELQAILDHIKTGKLITKSGMKEVLAQIDPKAIIANSIAGTPGVSNAPVAAIGTIATGVATSEAVLPLTEPIHQELVVAQDMHPDEPIETHVSTYVAEYPVVENVEIEDMATQQEELPSFVAEENLVDDRSKADAYAQANADDADLYNMNSFTV